MRRAARGSDRFEIALGIEGKTDIPTVRQNLFADPAGIVVLEAHLSLQRIDDAG